MRLFFKLLLVIPTVFTISIPGENVDKKKLSTAGIKTIEWQEENDLKQQKTPSQAVFKPQTQNQYTPPRNGLFEQEEDDYSNGQLQLGSNNQYQQSSHDLFQIIDAEQSHYQDLENFEQEYASSNREEESLYTKKEMKKVQAFSKCPDLVTGPLPYAYSCSQFLNCYKGRTVIQNCAPGTLFNSYTLECDYASKVECLDESESDYTQQNLASLKLKTGCPKGFSGVVPHHFDCSKFINCDNGKEVVMDCGPGTLFNLKINSCDFPYNTECASWSSQFGNLQQEEDFYNENVNSQQSSDFGNQPAESTYNYQQQKPKCPPHAVGLYPHPWDCAKFLNCATGQTFIQDCGPGTVFNPLSKVCDFPHNVDCKTHDDYRPDIDVRIEHNQAKGSPTNVYQKISCPPKAYGLYPYPNICSKFIDCRYGKTEIKECPQGLMFNIVNRGCDYPYNVDCKRKNLKEIWKQDSNTEQSWNHQQNTDQLWNQGSYNQGGKPQPDYNQNWNQQNTGQTTHNQGGKPQPDYNQNWNQQNTGQTTHNQGGKPQPDYNQNWNQQNTGQFHNQEESLQPDYNPNWNQQNTGQPWTQGSHTQAGKPQPDYNQNWNQQNTGQPWNQGSHTQGGKPQPDYNQNWNQQNTGQATNNQGGKPQPNYNQNWNQQHTDQKWNQQNTGENSYNSSIDKNWNKQNTNKTWNQQNFNQNWGQQETDHSWNQGSKPQNGNKPNSNQQNVGQKPIKPDQSWNQANNNQNWNQQNTGQTWNQKPSNQGQSWNQESTSQNIDQNWNQQHTDQNWDQNWNQQNSVNQQTWNQSKIQTSHQGQATSQHEIYEIYEKPPRQPNANVDNNNVKPTFNSRFKDICSVLDFYCTPTQCVPKSMRCDGVTDCPNGNDEKDCEAMLKSFTHKPNYILAVREKEKFFNISILNCARSCLDSKGFQCRSFSYRKDDGACFISDGNVGSTGALILSYAYDYYELNALSMNCSNLFVCPNKKCISQKQICDGVNDCGDRVDEKGCTAKAFGYEIKLAGTRKKDEGRIEIKAFGKVGYICDDKFGLRNGDVVCKELGFPLGALEIKSNSYYSDGLKDEDVFYMMDDVVCLGNETSIRDCDFNGWGISNCEAQEVVGLICKTPKETCRKDDWKCDSVDECVPLIFVCDGVNDCSDESDEATQHCDAPTELRLADGKSKYEGRVEIRHYGIWGTVCDDDFNDDAAKVVCKYLGHPGKAVAKKDGTFGPGKGPIWLDQVYCQGNESALHHCVHWNWGEHNCEHSEDVGVVCSNLASEIPVVESQRSAHIDNLPESVIMNQCGLRKDAMFLTESNVHFRVIGGAIANKGDYPWQASLRVKSQSKMTHWCGAIVISKKFILTAAHCLQGFSKGSYVVVAGDYNTDEDEETEQEAFIEEFYIHEDFRKGQKMNNDIALIKLKGEGFTLTKDVQPICLPDRDIVYETGLNCTISGFGTIQSGKSMYSHDMRAVWIPLIDQEVCRMPHVYGNVITDGMLCAGFLTEGADACEGDSGGPLACLHDGYYTLYGITSWGHHCGHANKPGVYVRVAQYRHWIDETIRKHI